MQTFIVVPAFDEVKDRMLGVRAGQPAVAVAVDQVLLSVAKKLSAAALS